MRLILFLLLCSFFSFAQSYEGFVIDKETNIPIGEVHVYLKKSQKGTRTGIKGKYDFKYKFEKNDTLHFSHIGYITQKKSFLDLKKQRFTVYLVPDVEKLTEVLVSSDIKLRQTLHFTNLKSMNSGLHSFGSLLKENIIYVIGGDASHEVEANLALMDNNPNLTFADFLSKSKSNFSRQIFKGDLQVYDIGLDQWKVSDLNFRKRGYHNLHFFNNKIYVFGGKRISKNRKFEYLEDKIEVFDLKTNSILIDHTNPHQAIDFASFIYKDDVIVMGGSIKKKESGNIEYSKAMHLYNLKSGFWYELGVMPMAKEVQGILVANKIYLIGGFNKKPLKTIETYDLSTRRTWQIEGDLFKGIDKPALAYNDEIIYIYDNGKMFTYNMSTKKLSQYFIDVYLKASELHFKNDKLYLLGGYYTDEFSARPSSRLISIDINEFKRTKIQKSKTL